MAAFRLSMSQGASPAARRAAAAPLRAGDPRRSSAGSGLGMGLEYECPIALTFRPAPDHAGGAPSCAGAALCGARGWSPSPTPQTGEPGARRRGRRRNAEAAAVGGREARVLERQVVQVLACRSEPLHTQHRHMGSQHARCCTAAAWHR